MGGMMGEPAKGAFLVGAVVLLTASSVQGQACCGDCNVDGTTSVDEIINVVGGALGDCPYQITAVPLLASGQTTDNGPGSDGNVRAGAPLSYRDNGDGTITDLNTGLIWEKKGDATGVHDKERTFTWCATRGLFEPECIDGSMSGTIVTEFLDVLNDAAGNGTDCFAGLCDWRIPNVRELQSIADYEALLPSVDPVFHRSQGCGGCQDVASATCSCAASGPYWTSTSAPDSTLAWFVDFSCGRVNLLEKHRAWHVRAVRGGL